jgi:CRP/FNR family transcriptional regulator, cyclic AMP receptor protein
MQKLLATIEKTSLDRVSKNKLHEIRQSLAGKINELNEALQAIDHISGDWQDDVTSDAFSIEETRSGQWASCQIIPEGSQVFQQGSAAKEIYSIEKGLVKLLRREEDGKEAIAAIRYPGCLLGTASVILDEPFSVSAVTVTPCHLYRIAAQDFRSLMRKDQELSWKIHQMMARELDEHLKQLTGIECLTARERLEEFLWQLISSTEPKPSGSVRLQLPAKHFEIAQLLAMTPQYLSWLIAELEKDEMIQRDRGWLRILRPESLWHRKELETPSQRLIFAEDTTHIILYK